MANVAVADHSEIVEAAATIQTRINKQGFSHVTKTQEQGCSYQHNPSNYFYNFHLTIEAQRSGRRIMEQVKRVVVAAALMKITPNTTS